MYTELKALMESFIPMGVPGFDAIILKDGVPVFRHRTGFADVENQIPMQGNERFNIYSCTKMITCTAVLQLWEKGLFSLEDPISKYMPEFQNMTVRSGDTVVPAEKAITIRHLMTMTAGLSYNTKSPHLQELRERTGGNCSTREFVQTLAKEPLLFQPGSRWEYSLCHDVLAALVEVISGEKFEDYVKKHIFDVCKMSDSTFMLPESELESVAPQYKYEDGKIKNIGKQIIHKFGSEYASGGAGCISTVDDYIKFLEAVRTFKLLKPETISLMTTARLSEKQKKTCWVTPGYGYGLGVRCPVGNKVCTSFGWDGAAGALAAIDMEEGISVYFASHIIASPAQSVRYLIFRFVRAEIIDGGEFEDVYKELEKLNIQIFER